MYSQEEFHAPHIQSYICEPILPMPYILLQFNLVFRMSLEKSSNSNGCQPAKVLQVYLDLKSSSLQVYNLLCQIELLTVQEVLGNQANQDSNREQFLLNL
jgi:hypothetical protein